MILRLFLAVVVLVVVGVLGVFLYVDRLARAGIERGGTHALGVPTTLEEADVGIFSGTFAMAGLSVANPQGYPADHFLRLDTGNVAVTLSSLREDTVELPSLALSGLDMVLERHGDKANYQVILDNLKRLESGEKPPAEPEGGKRFVIRKLEIRGVQVHLDLLPAGGELTKISIPIDRIELSNIGSETKGGVLIRDLAGVLVKAVLGAVIEKGGNLPADLRGSLEAGLGQLKPLEEMGIGVVTDIQKKLEDALRGDKPLDDIQKDVQDTIKGLGDILGGDKKKK
jgi:hypothetical protein